MSKAFTNDVAACRHLSCRRRADQHKFYGARSCYVGEEFGYPVREHHNEAATPSTSRVNAAAARRCVLYYNCRRPMRRPSRTLSRFKHNLE